MNEAEIVRGIRVSRDGSRLVVRWKRLARNVNGCGARGLAVAQGAVQVEQDGFGSIR